MGVVLDPVIVAIAFAAAVVVADEVFAEPDAAAAGLVTASVGGAVTAAAVVVADAVPFAAAVEDWDLEACRNGTWRGP